ncbi:MAG: Acetyltransferase, family [Candidatus Solibacter sp.]|nr:Acetyltransferase, family [Candidatus Solibacter sp.]
MADRGHPQYAAGGAGGSGEMMAFRIRLARAEDVEALTALIDASVRELQVADYTAAQIEESLKSVYGVDTQLIADGTYFAVEAGDTGDVLVGCGGWSKRRTLYGGDQFGGREDSLLDPACDAARIRAFFVHPRWARRGIGALLLEACESAAVAAGFTRLEMGATLTGVPFYRAKGYQAAGEMSVPMGNGLSLAIVRMWKTVNASPPPSAPPARVSGR